MLHNVGLVTSCSLTKTGTGSRTTTFSVFAHPWLHFSLTDMLPTIARLLQM